MQLFLSGKRIWSPLQKTCMYVCLYHTYVCMYICRGGHTEFVTLLLQREANANVRGLESNTPLHHAALEVENVFSIECVFYGNMCVFYRPRCQCAEL
jgi:hypothetical protein